MSHCISLLILPALICASEDTLKVAQLQMLPDGNNVPPIWPKRSSSAGKRRRTARISL